MRIPSTNLHWIEQFNETRRATGENEGHLSEKLANQEQETAKGMYNSRVDVNLQLQWICGKVFAREKINTLFKPTTEKQIQPSDKKQGITHSKKTSGAGVMPQILRAPACSSRGPEFDSGTHMTAHRHLQCQSWRPLLATVDVVHAHGMQTHLQGTCTPLYTHNKFFKKENKPSLKQFFFV